jgi:hypothetical protein
MVRSLIVFAIVAMFSTHISLAARSAQDGAQQPEETTVAGCLQAGSKEGEFVLVNDEKTTYQVQAAEDLEVAPHVNHRVELTGTVEKTESSLVMKAKALKMVSTSCSQ